MPRGKKNLSVKLKDNESTKQALELRAEMISIFEDLKHNPHNHELLARFHEKCEEFNSLLKKVNEQYEEMQTGLGEFKTPN